MIGKASEIKTDTVERHAINHGMSLITLSEVVNAWLERHPDAHVIDIKPTANFALIIYKN